MSIHIQPVFLSFRLTHVKKEIVVRLATRTGLGSGDDSRAGEWGSGRLREAGRDGEDGGRTPRRWQNTRGRRECKRMRKEGFSVWICWSYGSVNDMCV